MRFTLSKKVGQNTHFRRRGLERLGIYFNKKDRHTILDMIRNNKAKLIKRQSLRLAVWEVTYAGKTFKIVHDKMRHSLVTVLL